MSMSLRDQLLAAGLGSKQQAKKARDDAERDRHRQQHQQGRPQAGAPGGPGGRPLPPVQRQDAAKLARDQELERKKREKAERKERAAQVKQLVDQHALPRLESDDFYNFVHDGRIARIAVDAARRASLVGGALAIVRTHGQYFVVPAEAIARIRERDPRAVVSHQGAAVTADTASGTGTGASSGEAADDPYARFEVPDDLMW